MIPTPPHARSTLLGLRCRARALVCLAALVLSTSAVWADQPAVAPTSDPEAILFQDLPSVFSASKYEQKTTEAPSAVTIITADEIEKYGYHTLAEVLRSVPGFYVTDDRNYNYLGIRGFNRPGDYNTHVLLLVDGHRLNDNVYNQAAIGTEAVVDVDLIDRIEIIRGPSSPLYGTNAFFGVINVLTKRGRDIRGTELSTEVGSYDSYTARVTYGNRFANGMDVLLSGAFYDSDDLIGLEQDPDDNLFMYRNADQITAHGFELTLDIICPCRWRSAR